MNQYANFSLAFSYLIKLTSALTLVAGLILFW